MDGRENTRELIGVENKTVLALLHRFCIKIMTLRQKDYLVFFLPDFVISKILLGVNHHVYLEKDYIVVQKIVASQY